MKKINLLFLSSLMLTSLVACGPSTPTSNITSNITSNSTSDVTSRVEAYNIHVMKVMHGKITADKESAKPGERVTLTSTPDKGYVLEKIMLDDIKLQELAFTMPDHDVSVVATFKEAAPSEHTITLASDKHGFISASRFSAMPGETIELSFKATHHYSVYGYFVDDEKIEGNSFIMPNYDVTVRGDFQYVFKDAAAHVKVTSATIYDANAYYWFKYEENGFRINVKVEDYIVVDDPVVMQDPCYRDNIQVLVTPLTDQKGWQENTYSILVSADNIAVFEKARNADNLGIRLTPSRNFKTKTYKRTTNNFDGYSGYEVDIFIPYSDMNTSYNLAKGNLTVCPTLRNLTNQYKNDWGASTTLGNTWEDCNTHILINENNAPERNPHNA